mgnify:FL=1
MPYIDKATRNQLDERIDSFATQVQSIQKGPHTTTYAGILNYTCTSLALKLFPQKKYWVLALVCGVFITVILEYYRRWVAPYEDAKIKENGDVYPD